MNWIHNSESLCEKNEAECNITNEIVESSVLRFKWLNKKGDYD